MPRRSILSATEQELLLALPEAQEEFMRHYPLSEADLSLIRQHRGAANRLGFAVQLCYLRFPGLALGEQVPDQTLLAFVAAQLKPSELEWDVYGLREQTRREHLIELQAAFGFQTFALHHYREAVEWLTEVALQTGKGAILSTALIAKLRRQAILLPAVSVLERLMAEALTRANRQLYQTLTKDLTPASRQALEDLLTRRADGPLTWLAWLRQAPAAPTSRQLLEHLARLRAWQGVGLPASLAQRVHQNRLLKIAREGGQMTPADLARFEPARRLATLVALTLEGIANVLDELLDLHDRIISKVFNAAQHQHQQRFQASGKAINQQVRLFGRVGQALLQARETSADPFVAIEAVVPWEEFTARVEEAQKLAQPADLDFLYLVGEHYATLRRYAPAFLAALPLRAAPTARSAEHYTDTAGFTDHLFGLMPLLSYRFAPRIRDLSDTKLYVPPGSPVYEALQPLLSSSLNVRHILVHWEDILRLATSIKQGTVTASLMLRKLGSYPRQNGLAVALRELGRLERSLFVLDRLQSVELRRRVQIGLNKGEARNALARAVFFHRLGEIRDRGFGQQRYRASGLKLLTAAIVRWNTVYLERAVQFMRAHGHSVDEALLPYLSPLGWEHINLTGDYTWRTKRLMSKFHPLRPLSRP